MRIYIITSLVFVLASCGTVSMPSTPSTTITGSTSSGTLIATGASLSGTVASWSSTPSTTQVATGSTASGVLVFQGNTAKASLYHTAGVASDLFFDNTVEQSMYVTVTTPADPQGNIRLSQIIMPDGTADGPFGSDTSYALDQTGTYELIFSEDLMAGDPWSGSIDVSVVLSGH